ncbi:MAG: hypothetical protein EB072_18645, partial [Betaproteobacteria bacterium]|nr:hypothetical protein [Betaproteobacteria bacterium]
AREESTSMRRTIEATLRQQGLSMPPPRSLEEVQERAKAYGEHAAQKMEALNEKSSLRDQIEAAWTADQGLQRQADAGLTRNTMGSVLEQSDARNTTTSPGPKRGAARRPTDRSKRTTNDGNDSGTAPTREANRITL